MHGALVWSLVTELRSHMPQGMAKKKKKDARKATIGVIGHRNFAKSLTIWLIRCGYHDIVTGSRNPKFAAEFYPHMVDATHQKVALINHIKYNVVAIYRNIILCSGTSDICCGWILIDVSNNTRINQYPTSNVEYLASLFLDSLIVKVFNVVSTWASGPITLCH